MDLQDLLQPGERWEPAAEWESFYQVSDSGRVYGLPRLTVRGIRGGKILKPEVNQRGGYLVVTLYRGVIGPDGIYRPSEKEHKYIHQLVLETFVGECPPGQEARHGPGGKHDNSLQNLCYGSDIENCEDRARDGIYHYKLTRSDAAVIRMRHARGESPAEIASYYQVSRSGVYKIIRGERWRAA